MTKDEFKRRVYQIFTQGQFLKTFEEEINRLICSGSIDFEQEKQFGAARMVLIAAMENTLTHLRPTVSKFEEMLNNLRRI